jgi:hypothetical protein
MFTSLSSGLAKVSTSGLQNAANRSLFRVTIANRGALMMSMMQE